MSVTQSGSNATLNFTTGTFLSNQTRATVSGQNVTWQFGFQEDLVPGACCDFLTVSGESGSVPVANMTGTWNGFYMQIGGPTCNAADHRFTFTRR